jgi:hypothetical protein
MTTAALKKKLTALVNEKRSVAALRRIHDLLMDPFLEEEDAADVRKRLERAEADFKEGRVMSVEEARSRLRSSLKRHRAAQGRATKRA